IAPGTVAYVDGPHGNLTLQDRKGAGIALIAGGVGIAPLFGILRQLCHDRDKRPIVLLYGNRVRDQIVYAEELAGMQKILDLRIEHVLGEPPQGWQERTGIIDASVVTDILARPGAENWMYFVCGPLPMIESVETALLAMGVPSRQIVSERFYYD
ncbi:MAG: ferredoxin--NADP reductase, partial [Alphaproteobacteria bacterium]